MKTKKVNKISQEVVIILDRSGSMRSIKNEMEEQIKSILTVQREAAPNSTISIYSFDDKFEVVLQNKSI